MVQNRSMNRTILRYIMLMKFFHLDELYILFLLQEEFECEIEYLSEFVDLMQSEKLLIKTENGAYTVDPFIDPYIISSFKEKYASEGPLLPAGVSISYYSCIKNTF